MKKKILIIAAVFVFTLLSLCSCASDKNVPAATEETAVASVSEETMYHRETSDINEIELDRINRISSYVLDEETFTNDEAIVSGFLGIAERLTPNDDTELPENFQGVTGGWYEIMAYSDDELLYTFLLSSGKNEDKKVRVDDGATYFYCDISADDAEAFAEIYRKIYNLSDLVNKEDLGE